MLRATIYLNILLLMYRTQDILQVPLNIKLFHTSFTFYDFSINYTVIMQRCK